MDQEITACKQLTSDGRLRHLLNLRGLERSLIQEILNQSEQYLCKPGAIIIHPGPMNSDVRISGEVADGPQSVITQQVTNGLAVCMAILAAILSGKSSQ